MGAALSGLFADWSSYYGNHQALAVTIRYLHLAGLVAGGGAAIALDREVLRGRGTGLAAETLERLHRSHRIILVSLGLTIASGAMMAAADVDTYLVSTLFWTKMALVVLLLVNGAVLARSGAAARRGGRPAAQRLVVTSVMSVVLWLAVMYASSWLMVAA